MMRWNALLGIGLGALLAAGCTPSSGGGGDDPPAEGLLVSVAIEPASVQLMPGESIDLIARGTFDDDSQRAVTDAAIWSSADEAVAAFDANVPGRLTAGAEAGTVEVVAVVDGIRSAPLVIDVAAEVGGADSIAIELVDGEGPLALERGQTAALRAIATHRDGTTSDVTGEVEWSVSDPAIATVDGGVLTPIRRGAAEILAVWGGAEDRLAFDVVCPYPTGAPGIGFGQTVPELNWDNAYNPDGSRLEFSMKGFHCDPEYDDRHAMILVLGAGWCSPCTQYATQLLNPISESLVDAGAQILWVEAQDYNYNPSGSDFAYEHLRRLIGEGPGIRVGDADTLRGDQAARAFIQNLPNVDAFPQVWVIRRSDMRVIADQGIGQFYLPLPDIVADVEADWSNPPPYRPPFVAACDPEDEEIYEPNDTVLDGGFLQPGSFDGGLCTEPAVDFYTVGLQGAWRLTVDFENAVGDIDIALWDKRTDQPVIGPDGQQVGSFSTSDQEVFEYFGPADVQVYGYNNASGRYTLTLEER